MSTSYDNRIPLFGKLTNRLEQINEQLVVANQQLVEMKATIVESKARILKSNESADNEVHIAIRKFQDLTYERDRLELEIKHVACADILNIKHLESLRGKLLDKCQQCMNANEERIALIKKRDEIRKINDDCLNREKTLKKSILILENAKENVESELKKAQIIYDAIQNLKEIQ